MKPNPYKTPNTRTTAPTVSRNEVESRGFGSAPLYLLLGIAGFTLLLAWIDAIHEGVSGITFILQVSFGAVVAQVPGLVCGALHRKSANRISFVFLIPAFAIAVISLLIYVMYVLAGQVQTVDNAGQMHVIFIPILLVIFAFFAYAIAGAVVALMSLLNRNE